MYILARLLCPLIYSWVRAMAESDRRLEGKRKEEARALSYPSHSAWSTGQTEAIWVPWLRFPLDRCLPYLHGSSVLWVVPAPELC